LTVGVIPASDGHGHGTEGHDRLLIVCFDRLDRLKRSNVIVLIVLEGQTDDHGHRLLGIKDNVLTVYDRLLQLDIGSVVMISFCKLATLPSWSWVQSTLTLQLFCLLCVIGRCTGEAGKLLPIGGVMRMHMHLRGIMGTCMLSTARQHISKSACLIYLFKEIDTFCSKVFDIIFWIFLEDRTAILFNQMI
jgi:hypothetical protein